MSSLRVYLAGASSVILIAACSGSTSAVDDALDSGGGPGSDGAASSDGSSDMDASGHQDGSSGADSSAMDSGMMASDSAMTIDGNDGGGCPNVFGGYTMMTKSGGCGDFNTGAKQCIVHNGMGVVDPNACMIRFTSNTFGGAVTPGVSGPIAGVDLTPGGTFGPINMNLGEITNANGCVGLWNETEQKMTMTCASTTGGGGACTVTMIKTLAACP